MHISLNSGSIFSEGIQQKKVKQLLRVSKTLKCQSLCHVWEGGSTLSAVTGMFVCTEGDKSFCEWTLNRCDTKTSCNCTFSETGRDILCVLSAVWSIASAWKERRPFENKPFPVGLERLLCKSLLKQSHPQHLHQRERQEGWLHVCACHSLYAYSIFLYVFWECSEGVWWRGESCQCCTQRR